MADDPKQNTGADIDLDTVDLGAVPGSAPLPPRASVPAAAPVPAAIPPADEIAELEKNYKDEISVGPGLNDELEILDRAKKEVEETIKKNEDAIRRELATLKSLKNEIENKIKKTNELKELGREIDLDREEVGNLEEKIKLLEEKLKSLR